MLSSRGGPRQELVVAGGKGEVARTQKVSPSEKSSIPRSAEGRREREGCAGLQEMEV